MFSINEIVRATKGTLENKGKPSPVKGVSTDSRTIKKGDLFIAIQGENFDGHRFLHQVIHKGACAVIVSRKVPLKNKNISVIRVQDTVKALGRLARFHRDRFEIPVIAITGSAGKTTTKEMTAAVLAKKYRVLKNASTQNNHIGVPATLLKLTKQHQVAVVELGTNHFGEIRWLTQVANPTVSIFTNIGESHLEFLKNEAGVFREKFDLARYMKPKGTVIFNNDDTYLSQIPQKTRRHRLISFGVKSPSDCHVEKVFVRKEILYFSLKGENFSMNTPVLHNVYNALAAISAARLFHISYEDIRGALSGFQFPGGRQAFKKLGPYRVIDDCYNANPISFRSAISTLSNLNNGGRRILVCGDMLELGSRARCLHEDIGELAGKSGFDSVFSIGRLAKWISRKSKEENEFINAQHFSSFPALYRRLKAYLKPGDNILVKGSRGMRLECVIELLEKKG